MARSFVAVAVTLAVLAMCLAPVAAYKGYTSCIALPDCFSPGYTYKIVYTANKGDCCKLCSYDAKCLVWTRETYSGLCALKSDGDVLTYAHGVESGVKYLHAKVPELDYNDIGASVLIGRRPKYPRKHHGFAHAGASVSVSASSTSYGGSAVSIASAGGPGETYTYNSVAGAGHSSSYISTPRVSLATITTKEYGKPPKTSYFYYKKPYIKGTVPIRSGKVLPVIYPGNDDKNKCYKCQGFPCTSSHGYSYKEGGEILADLYDVPDEATCCARCREYKGCVSWWRNPKSGRCVLNKNLPKLKEHGGFYCGTVV